ncbi:signal-regulatory protein beta-1-like [Mauremys mutica]|uniref:signal-regulatory protein beta-1-like n=1 Tax=Mauremys mutica TaxID=74926 RepID=UPI001D163972|nr:signal-regulatory protein beta-1-like [Mauremys mutica]
MATLWGRRAGTMGLGGLLIPLLVLGVADSQLVLSMGPSPVRAALGSDVQLPCTFTVRERFEITKFYLAWSLGGHRVAEYVREQKIYQQGSELFPEELSRGNCSLLLHQVAVRDGGRYTSTVIYTPDKEEKQLELQVTAAPRLSVPRKAGVLNAASSFPCHVWGFYPGDVTVTWLRDGQVLTDATRSAPQRNSDGTFNLTLTYTFTPNLSDSSSIFSCHVSHVALAQPLREEFPLVIGAAPRISVPRRSAVRNAETFFPCHVWGFYPGDVTVTWLRDGQVLTDATRSAPQRNPDGTFNLTAIYMFTPTTSDSGSIFSCRVSHPALAQPLREEFPLDVTGMHGSTTVLTAVLGILGTLAAVTTALATYFWCRWKGRCATTSTDGKAPYSVSEVLGPVQCLLGHEVTLSYALGGKFPKDTAVTWEWIHGEDKTVIGTDGVSEAGEGPEHQPLLHPQPPGWKATQERSGTCLTASLSFTPTVQDDGARVRCSFHHEARGIREQRESGEIRPWSECPQDCEVSLGPLP